MKALEKIVEMLFWILIFLCPVLVLGIVGLLIYYKYDSSEGLIVFVLLGCTGGAFLAEKVRKKTGASAFFGKLMNMPELDVKSKYKKKYKIDKIVTEYVKQFEWDDLFQITMEFDNSCDIEFEKVKFTIYYNGMDKTNLSIVRLDNYRKHDSILFTFKFYLKNKFEEYPTCSNLLPVIEQIKK